MPGVRSVPTSKQSRGAVKKASDLASDLASEKQREDRGRTPVCIFLNNSVCTLHLPPPSSLLWHCQRNCFSCQNVKWQNVQCRRISHTLHTWLCAREARSDWRQRWIDQSQRIPGACIPKRIIENNVYRLHFTVCSQPPCGFHALVLDVLETG